jgi:predicted TIM-barrel fold metal-dependent hydrolase
MHSSPNHLYVLIGFTLALAVSACGAPDDTTSDGQQADAPERSSLPKIDVHAHYSGDRPYFSEFLDDWSMRAVTVEVVGSPDNDRSTWDAMKQLHEQYPDRLFLCTSFNPFPVDGPDYAENVISQLKRDIADGASMVKVWKVVGMEIRDSTGAYVQIDDPRYQPIWDFLADEGIPVLAHLGEPRIAWRPIEGDEPHAGYFESHPEYHAYRHPEMPHWTEIMAARDRWLKENPDLTVIGAHLGSMSDNVAEVAERMEQYPNFYVDTAARFVDLAHQPSDSVRAFFMEYRDRVLYGTDMGLDGPADSVSTDEMSSERGFMEKMLSVHWEYLTSPDSMYFDSPMGSSHTDTKGLGLPSDVVRKVYHDNAERILNR